MDGGGWWGCWNWWYTYHPPPPEMSRVEHIFSVTVDHNLHLHFLERAYLRNRWNSMSEWQMTGTIGWITLRLTNFYKTLGCITLKLINLQHHKLHLVLFICTFSPVPSTVILTRIQQIPLPFNSISFHTQTSGGEAGRGGVRRPLYCRHAVSIKKKKRDRERETA